MNKEFVPYEQSLELKRLGFNEHCFGAHAVWGFMSSNDVNSLSDNVTQEDLDNQAYLEEDGVCLAPLYQQVFRWFREKYRLFGQINIHTYFIYDISNDEFKMIRKYYKVTNTYEEAELTCLKNLIDIVKNK